jgi:hypothetical protein
MTAAGQELSFRQDQRDGDWRVIFVCRMHPQKKSAAGKLLREFYLGSIFDFFNRIALSGGFRDDRNPSALGS